MKTHTFRKAGFTLVELLVTCAILAVMLVMMMKIIGSTGEMWKSTNEKIEIFKGARLAFRNMTQLIGQATVNTYWDYDNPSVPTRYIRKSELHFVVDNAATILPSSGSGSLHGQAIVFQAPANQTSPVSSYDGLKGLLNACGFFVEYGSDAAWLPTHIAASQAKERYRLMQWMQNTESLGVYATSNGDWIQPAVGTNAFPVADNVIALVLWPKEEGDTSSLLDRYTYNSRTNANADPQPVQAHQLPPVVQVAMVAIDEGSATRLAGQLKGTIDECLDGLFVEKPSEKLKADLSILETRLSARKVRYQVFFSSIPLHESKWSHTP